MEEKKFKKIVGRVWYYEGGYKRMDGQGAYVPVSERLWNSLFPSDRLGDIVVAPIEKVEERPIVKDIPKEVVKKGVVGRPRKEVVGVRAIQYRNKADGLSRSVGRPKKDK
jgi:hypothetical protein